MADRDGSGRRIPIAEPILGDAELDRLRSTAESGQLAAGETVREFEAAFAAFCRARHGVATANGTAALHTALRAAGIGDGDRVVTSPFSYIATANAIRLAGAEPVFADVRFETFTLDPHAVERTFDRFDGDVDAILAVHLYGFPASLDHLREIADRHDALLVEDAAQAHGARFDGHPVGAIGDVGTFSFYPTKNMTTGEGGMVVTDRDDIARRARRFVNHGRDGEGVHRTVGHNFRMTELEAAIGLEQLDRLPSLNERRRANAGVLTRRLEDTPVMTPVTEADRRHVFHQYTVRTQSREALADHLAERGIETAVYYPRAIHEEPAYEGVEADLPVAERAASEVLSLPVHPGVSSAEVETVATAVREFFSEADTRVPEEVMSEDDD
jgi:dTDP-4-amino-4,6-dideoxygalactose transaminase